RHTRSYGDWSSDVCSSDLNPDGAVCAIVPGTLDDNGVGIDSYLETACPQDLMRPNQLGGVQMNIDGTGQGSVEVLALRAKDPKRSEERRVVREGRCGEWWA